MMKRALQLVIAMSLVAMFLVSPVAAATSEGLEWGVALDDEFTFQYTVVEEGVTTFAEGVNFTVASTPAALPDPMPIWSITPVFPDMVFTNGTILPSLYAIYLIGIMFAGGSFAVPIGNFTLLSELVQDTVMWNENSTLVNDGTKWGVHYTDVDSESTLSLDVHYMKADVFISNYNLRVTNTTSGKWSGATLVRDGTGLDIIGLLTDNILYVGIGVGVIVILGAVVCMRRK